MKIGDFFYQGSHIIPVKSKRSFILFAFCARIKIFPDWCYYTVWDEFRIDQAMDKPDGNRKANIHPEIIFAAGVVIFIAMALVGIMQGFIGAIIAALTLVTYSLIMGDLAWSLDFRRTETELREEKKDTAELEAEEARFRALHRPLIYLLGGICVLVSAGFAILRPQTPLPEKSTWVLSMLVFIALLGALIWWFGNWIIVSPEKSPDDEKHDEIINWSRFTSVLMLIAGISLIGITSKGTVGVLPLFLWLNRLAGIFVIFTSLEMVFIGAGALFFRKKQVIREAPLQLHTVGFIGSFLRGAPGVEKHEKKKPDVGISGAPWLGPFLSRSLPRIVVGIVLILWITTCFTQVGLSETGLRERFGRSTGEVLEPGIHVSWPWPIDRVITHPSKYIQTMLVGYAVTTESSRQDLIWSEAHGIEEDRFLTADGHEVISVDIELSWRIKDTLAYAYTALNPEFLLKEIAYKTVMHRTNTTDIDSLVSHDRSELAEGMKQDIQQQCDDENLGIVVTKVLIIAIHPPFEVADAYQSVVSAQVYRDTLSIQGSTYREDIIPAARAEANTSITLAEAYAEDRLARARGEAAAFELLLTPVSEAFYLYKYRSLIETLEERLPDKRLYVVSTDFLGSGDLEYQGIWLDLR